MQRFILISAGFLGMLAVIFGAFGAHALKEVLNESQLASWETGVRYQFIHVVILLLLGFVWEFKTRIQRFVAVGYFIGMLLFSVSIYLLSLQDVLNLKLSFLGPITPIGGFILIVSWALLALCFIRNK